MAFILIALGALGWVVGLLIFGSAKSAVHEIEAILAMLLGTISFGIGAVVVKLNAMIVQGEKIEQTITRIFAREP